MENIMCQLVSASDETLIWKMPMFFHRYALWLINFPDQESPTIKCSRSLCHIQSVRPLSQWVSTQPGWFHFCWPLIALAPNVRAKSITVMLFASSILSFISSSLNLHIHFQHHLEDKKTHQVQVQVSTTDIFPLTLTYCLHAFPSSHQYKFNFQVTIDENNSSLVTSFCVWSGMQFTELVLALHVTPVSLVWYFEDEESVLINQTVRPLLGQVRWASKELSDIYTVLIGSPYSAFALYVTCTSCSHTCLLLCL